MPGVASGLNTFRPFYAAKILLLAAVFNEDLFEATAKLNLPNTNFVLTRNLVEDYPPESFDYVVGTSILSHNLYSQNLATIYKLLKPGGQFLFFEGQLLEPSGLYKKRRACNRAVDRKRPMSDRNA